MAPRQAFPTHDLIPYILEHLQPPEHLNRAEFVPTHLDVARGKPWKTLASCARVSRAFSELALRLLWRELPSLLPLLSLGPPLLKVKDNALSVEYGDHDMNEEAGLWVFEEEPTQEELLRFAHYAALVRRISIPGSEHIDPAILFHLSRADSGQPLLPIVEEIKCRVSPHLDMIILLLAGRSLRELIVLEDDGDSYNGGNDSPEICAIARLISALPSRTPRLQSLCIYDKGIHCPFHLKGLGRLRELRSLRMKFRSNDLWFEKLVYDYALAKLDHLHELALPMDYWLPDNASMQRGFPQLRRLRLAGHHRYTMAYLDHLVKMMPPLRLECFEIVAVLMDGFTETHSHFDNFFTAYADTLSTVNLDIHAHEEEDPYPNLPTPVPAFNVLRSFLLLRYLRVCTITFAEKLSFTDDDLRKIQGVWPLLETFTLSWHSPYMEHSTPSLRGIINFFRECPRLAVFKISAVCVEGTRESCTALKALPSTFVVEDEHIHDPMVLADILRGLFPVLRIISSKILKGGSGKWGVVLSRLRDNVEGGSL